MGALLPPAPVEQIPAREDLEEVDLYDYDPNMRNNSSGRSEAYDDDDMNSPRGNAFPCAHQ